MKISILTMFPELFDNFLASPVVNRARGKGNLEVNLVDIKAYAKGSFRNIDDSPCGGGPGMLIRVDVLHNALKEVQNNQTKAHVVLLSPKGATYNQQKAKSFALLENLVLICGHYEGCDARIEKYVDEQISIGDFILTGGELAAMTIVDSVARLLKGSLRTGATEQESFEQNLLEYPQYTHPVEYNGDRVPEVLLSGDQGAIRQWKMAQSIMETIKFRPKLFNQAIVSKTFGDTKLEEIEIGKSSARIFSFNDMVLKIDVLSEVSKREYQALKWLEGRLPAPKLLGYESNDKKSYILMTKVKGKMLCDPSILSNRRRLLKSAVAALRTLWCVDLTNCPFSQGLDLDLKEAKSKHRFKPNSRGQVLLTWLEENRPVTKAEDLVLSHGDLCLPNILVSCHGIEGLLDFGRIGVADKWRDIVVCLRSLKNNLEGCGPAVYGPFDEKEFYEILGIEPDLEKIKYYTLLDQLL